MKASALAVMIAAMLPIIQPPEKMLPAVWAADNVIVPDGPQKDELLDLELTPYLVEPLNFFTFDDPANEIIVRKSAQTGFTMLLIAGTSYMIANEPCDALIVQPTQKSLEKFSKKKLGRVIEKTPALSSKVLAQISRSGESSTASLKQFPGGSLTLTISTSSADLRSDTIKLAALDEVDEYPDDLDGQGSVSEMVDARQTSFKATGEWKRAKVSTPTIKGESEIDTEFLKGDQRFWNCKCPGCGDYFKFVFDARYFKFDDLSDEAHYVTPCCGSIVEDVDKTDVIKTGKWIAENAGAGVKSYHFDSFTSPFVPFSEIAKKFKESEKDPAKRKTFYNLTLGLPFEMKGDAPDHERLMERRISGLKRGVIPANGVVIVCGCDVQGNGIYYNIRAFAPNGQNWPVDADFIAGETDDARAGAFLKLHDIVVKEWPDSYGGKCRIDMTAVDSGYRSNVVYTFAREHQGLGVVAIAGVDGWHKPAFGIGVTVEINYNNQRIRQGTVRYPIGTWDLKSVFYASLTKKGAAAGAECDPDNYIHFAGWQDESYFKQITGEYLATEKHRGKTRKIWKEVPGKENHFLDTEVYLRALFHHLTDRLTPDDWQALISQRNIPSAAINPDMFAPAPLKVAAKATPNSKQKNTTAKNSGGRGWFSKG